MTAGDGINNFISNVAAVAQALKTRLLLLYNEWWEDLEDGLPFFERIAGSRNIQSATTIIRQRMLTTIGVKQINNLVVDFTNRVLTITADVDTIYGDLPFTVEVLA